MTDDLAYLSAARLADLIRDREVSPVEVVGGCLERIERRNPSLNAFVTVCAQEATDAARQAERRVMAGEPLPPLHGVPIAIKDLDAVAGIRNTFGSVPFARNVATRDATHVARLRAAGAIVVGKTNTPEFGHKATTDNRLFGPARNPFDTDMNAGGSSGGSAAAVADGLVPLATGSDGGGSIRIPASMCGVFGMMATFGRVAAVARPNAFSLLTPAALMGPLTRTVQDAAIMLDVIGGPHPRDPYAVPATPDRFADALGAPLRGLRVAFLPDLGGFPVESDVAAIVAELSAVLADAGAHVEEVGMALPRGHGELAALWRRFSAVRNAETAEHFRRAGIDLLGEHADALSPDYAEILRMGGRLSAVEYRMDDAVRTEVLDAVEDVFADHDLIISPVLSVAAVRNDPGGDTVGPREVAGRAVDPLIGWCLTYPFNLTGHPAASVPAGRTAAGMPVGLQVVGQRFREADVLAAGAAIERHRPWQDAYAGRKDTR